MALSENFRRLIAEGVIDFAPDTIRVLLITAPPEPTADPGRIEPTEWVSEATDAERRAWRTAAYGDDDDAYEQVFGIAATNPFALGYRVTRFKPPKRSRWSHAGPFVYPRA